MNQITVDQLHSLDEADLIDVRERDEFRAGHVPGAINTPLSELGDHLAEIPTDRPVHVICQAGTRSAQATQALVERGVDAVDVAGGTSAWIRAGYPVETA